MRLPTVSSCCCGCSLRQGSIIIGVVFTAWHLAELITYSIYAEKELEYLKDHEEEDSSYRALLIVGATFAGVLLVANIVLLIGLQKERSRFLLPWLLINTVITILSFVVIWWTTYALFYHTSFIEAMGGVSGSILRTALQLYCIMVIYSYYRSLKEKELEALPPPPYQY